MRIVDPGHIYEVHHVDGSAMPERVDVCPKCHHILCLHKEIA